MNYSTRSGAGRAMQPARGNFAGFNDTILLTASQFVGEFFPAQWFSGWLFGGLTSSLPCDGRGNQCTVIFAVKELCH